MKVKDLFNVHNAKSQAFEAHESGNIPFITNGLANNGFKGYVKPMAGEKVFDFTGICLSAFAEATVHEPPYLPRGNGGSGLIVLEPKTTMTSHELLYYSAYINKRISWRFSFGRMVTLDRAKEIPLIDYDPSIKIIDESILLPPQNTTNMAVNIKRFAWVQIGSLFDLHSGDYHKASELPDGEIPLVSCADRSNGVLRYCDIPTDLRYQFALTIAYNGQLPLITKFHPYEFGAKDDVAVCIPKRDLRFSTLIFIQYMLNRETWRHSYGRKCYKAKLKRFKISLPVDTEGNIDEDVIEKIVSNASYWEYYKSLIPSSIKQIKPHMSLGTFTR